MEEELNSGKPKASEIIISLLIAVYFAFVFIWFLPESVFKSKVFSPMYTPWLYWGLNQSWSLFSPNIRQMNYYPSAIITFEDGSKALWEPPLMDKLTLVERFKREKFRKWSIDSLPWSRFKDYWPDFARYVGRKYYNPLNKPVSLSLNLRWIEIPSPSQKFFRQAELPPRTKFNTTFCYKYKPEDFK
ncbi:MAG TPA: hypothetical protein EYN91_01885 [Candidatus Melainabacteria bacterium]|jgi:hypothetical protein|nr:hypothetical protein [Candidatus Melainabacteria bacterium]